ncbi:mRNA-capping enzyme subunit beta [Ascosphaera atra]|nr:mRNA-capping enzyme subunit beta [Ascosphaera atra]
MDDVVTTPAPAADGTSRHLQSSPADKPHMASYSPSTAASYVPMQSKRPSFEMEVERERAAPPPSSAAPPAKRRKRYTEVPVFARRAQRKHGHPPVIPPPEQRNFTMFNWSTHRSGSDRVPPSSHLQSRRPTSSGHPEPMSFRDTAPLAPEAAKPFSEEPSITGFIPHEEITKVICDFLYQHVVDRKDIGVSGPGGNSGGQGAVLEVEAKLGRLIDRTRGDRLRLPVLTETVVDKETSGLRLGFKSSMTLDQHRALNNFLNTAITQSRLPNTKRVPMSYAHHKQRDIFYDLPPALVPIMIRHHLRPGHTPRVRVTVDQKTGEVIAKIVKCRLADLDVYSPRTCLDWRLSVNIEMAYDGDISELTPSHQGDDADSKGDRVKDRMSYMHMAYQVDLTQVEDKDAKTSGQSTHPNFEHELEIEISTAEVRRQGELAAANSANQYEELIKGFVDNVRILVRNVPPF